MQTAVDYLLTCMTHNQYFIGNDLLNAFEQAKEMEKQMIIDAFDEGQEYEYQYHINNAPKFDSHTYFAETYGSKGSDAQRIYGEHTITMLEISDEEIAKQGFLHSYANELPDENAISFIQGVKWYREQLKKKQ